MKTNKINSFFITFYNDFIIMTFSLLILIVVGTIASIIVTGSREEGMVYGLIGGLALGLISFYYFRGQFNFFWTIIQLTVNAGLMVGEFLIISFLIRDTGISGMAYGYIWVFISVPALISVNKQLLDILTKKLNGQMRKKQPIQIL